MLVEAIVYNNKWMQFIESGLVGGQIFKMLAKA